jgi:uncharacterized protein (DUF302 family)
MTTKVTALPKAESVRGMSVASLYFSETRRFSCNSRRSLQLTERNQMSAQQPQHSRYGFSKTVALSFDEAVAKATAALKEQGFGVLCEIDIKEKLREKLGLDFRRYAILGACNPPLAYRTLQEEINIGLLLPCNVIVYEAGKAGDSVVAAIDAKAMLSVVGDKPTLEAVATEVNEKLQRVIAQL